VILLKRKKPSEDEGEPIEDEDPEEDPNEDEVKPIEEEDPEEDPHEEEGEPIKEEDLEQDPMEDEEEPMKVEDLTEGQVKFIEEDDLMEEAIGNKDNGVEPIGGRTEPETMMLSWRQGKCRMCQQICLVNAPNQ